MTIVYKVTGPNGEAHIANNGFKWPKPSGKKPGKWVHAESKLVECRNGLHACRSVLDIGGHMNVRGFTVWFAEGRGETLEGKKKTAFQSLRLVKKSLWCKYTAVLFAADCAERSLVGSNWGDRRSWDAVSISRKVALDLAVHSAHSVHSAYSAAHSARSAADSARSAADSAARQYEVEWQEKRLLQYLEHGINAHVLECDGWTANLKDLQT